MSAMSGVVSSRKPGEKSCLARSVVRVLADEPSLEAVTIDRRQERVAIATLGRVDAPGLQERIVRSLREAERSRTETRCGLLEGRDECLACASPLDGQDRKRITISHEGNQTTIARVTCPTAPKFWRWSSIPWPKVVPREVEFLEPEEHLEEWKPQLLAAVLCGVAGIVAYFLERAGLGGGSLLAYALAYIAGSWYTLEEVWERLQKRTIDVHFLMLAVAVGSASIGAWGEGTMLLFLFSFSSALEHFALGRTQREIRSLFRAAPKFATVLDPSGLEREMPVDALRPGLRLLMKPGAQFPVDAEVTKGRTASDESNLTGEAVPVEKEVGDVVLAGTINLWGAVEVTVLRPASESSLQKIIHLIREAQHRKAPSQQFTDRFSSIYTYAVLGLTLIMFFVWWLGMGLAPFAGHETSTSAFYRAMALLVVASPCALVLSIPSAVLAAIAWGARHGILFRGGAAVEKLAEVDTVALDKTGTLTTGDLRVEQVESFPPGREDEVARLAYSMEVLSHHPLARAVVRYGKQQGISPIDLSQFESITGQGLRARENGRICLLGRRQWLETEGYPVGQSAVTAEASHSEVWVTAGNLTGRLILRDDIRPQSRRVVEELRAEGLHVVVLTGDRKPAAESLRITLGLEEVLAELKPEQKLEEIRVRTERGEKVAMVGDGVNDAPSLAAAHIGVAMGARGSDAAMEQSDVVLMHDRLENFLAAFRLSQRARGVIRQNLLVSLGTVVVLVTFALLGKMPLTVGVIGHEGSTVLVVMNSLRLLFGRSQSKS